MLFFLKCPYRSEKGDLTSIWMEKNLWSRILTDLKNLKFALPHFFGVKYIVFYFIVQLRRNIKPLFITTAKKCIVFFTWIYLFDLQPVSLLTIEAWEKT